MKPAGMNKVASKSFGWAPVTDGDNTGGSIMGCVVGLVAVVVILFLAGLAIYL